MKLVTVVGARPQFIKAAPVSRAIGEHNKRIPDDALRIVEILVHTGQHYADNMSKIFFEELELPNPGYNLGVGSGLHGQQTGEMLKKVEEVLLKERPDSVLVYGDTNSTLAGALAAAKLHIPVAHIEAGLRSFNKSMPEEVNRVVTDHLSDFLFCPTESAVENLRKEGIREGVSWVGDVMYDSLMRNIKRAEECSQILERLDLKPKQYALATVHRAENTDDPERLRSIFSALNQISGEGLPVIIPLHPRSHKQMEFLKLTFNNVKIIEPVSYLNMLLLERQARVILTDSGGVQKEAYFFRTPCLTFREETEWVETVETGWNRLVGVQPNRIIEEMKEVKTGSDARLPYGGGDAAERIVNVLLQRHS